MRDSYLHCQRLFRARYGHETLPAWEDATDAAQP